MVHDLSFNKVELSIPELIKLAGQAVKNSRSQINKYQAIVEDEIRLSVSNQENETKVYRHNHSAQFYAQEMANSAQEYANAMHNYFVLVECLHREEITINKEQIK